MQKLILSLSNLWVIGNALWLLPVGVVHADEIVCPEAIHVSQPPDISSVEGWEESSRSDRLWNDGGFISSGHPKELADLKGEEVVISAKKTIRWNFDANDNSQGIWFSCSYGKWHLLLSRKIQKSVTHCWMPNNLPAKLICK